MSTRVLVRAPNWLGDLVMSLPALQAVRRAFAAETLVAAARADLVPILRLVPGVDEIVSLPVRRLREEIDILRRGGYEKAILLPNSFGAAWAAWRAGIPERWGYRADFRRWLLTRPVRRPSRRRVRHQAEYYLHLVEALGIGRTSLPPSRKASADRRSLGGGGQARLLIVPTALRETAAALLAAAGWTAPAPLVALAPGAAYGHAKRWPAARFAEVAAALARDHGATCVLVGTAADRDAGHAIESWLAAREGGEGGLARRVANLIGRTDLLQLAGVLSLCQACVSNDSGAMHLAAACGVPVVGIFGPTDERATRPIGPHQMLAHPVWCRPCHLRDCPIDHRCMKRVPVAQVLAATGLALERTPA